MLSSIRSLPADAQRFYTQFTSQAPIEKPDDEQHWFRKHTWVDAPLEKLYVPPYNALVGFERYYDFCSNPALTEPDFRVWPGYIEKLPPSQNIGQPSQAKPIFPLNLITGHDMRLQEEHNTWVDAPLEEPYVPPYNALYCFERYYDFYSSPVLTEPDFRAWPCHIEKLPPIRQPS
ncbi:hypothetical protein Tco_1379590 [Tanacetum coccineum]